MWSCSRPRVGERSGQQRPSVGPPGAGVVASRVRRAPGNRPEATGLTRQGLDRNQLGAVLVAVQPTSTVPGNTARGGTRRYEAFAASFP